ncbi:MAG: hypothetical protein RIB46_01290 [Pseudomonadales bacterium]
MSARFAIALLVLGCAAAAAAEPEHFGIQFRSEYCMGPDSVHPCVNVHAWRWTGLTLCNEHSCSDESSRGVFIDHPQCHNDLVLFRGRMKMSAGFEVRSEGRCELGLVRLRPWDTLPNDSQDWLIDRARR